MKKTYLQSEKSIVLIGFMGVGKTTVGKQLAKQLGRQFIDTDEAIEDKFQMPTTTIFTKYGESFFRHQEKELILKLSQMQSKVISLGGGAFLQDEIKKACLTRNLVVHLDMTWKAWKKRLHSLIDTRPILQNKSTEEVRELFQERKAIYERHHIKIVTDGLSAEQVVHELIETLEQT